MLIKRIANIKNHTISPIRIRQAKRKRIMVADDDIAIVTMLTMMLEDAGYEVETTADCKIVENVNEYLPDLILLDIRMVGVDGRDICKYLKSQLLTKFIPIIMISANRELDTIAIEVGADDYIAKPFEMNNLLAKVAKYTGIVKRNSLQIVT